MSDLNEIGKYIREARLSHNLTMDYVAKKAGITRATLTSLENGTGNYSMKVLLSICEVLNVSFNLEIGENIVSRKRATKALTELNKKINRFVIMCIEQYAVYVNRDSASVYKELNDKKVIKELEDDYEDLHGMSTQYINKYIHDLIRS